MPKETVDLAVRKKMRKGTHSCFECRRRKIRCIFTNDNPDVCSECFARGSRCIDQEHADPSVVVDHRKNLRERVSRLEALVDALLEDKTDRSQADTSSSKTPNLVTRDTFPPTPISSEASSSFLQPNQRAPSDRGHHVPILSVFEDALNDAEERMRARMEPQAPNMPASPEDTSTINERFTVTCKNPEDVNDTASAAHSAKKERAKQGLLAALPPTDQLNKILHSNTEWWQTWRRKCSGTSNSDQSLAEFADKALADSNLGAIGTVVLSVGICSAEEADIETYIEAVDRFVLGDDEYAATLEGMELLILKAKWYADVGQPRRAWIAYRKGIMYAQLMGLHRKRTSSPAHESIWWSLYHGDRFLSLLLGLPYGLNDSHCDLSLPDFGGEYMAPLVFMNNISMIAGKVIDRNQGIIEHSFAWALQIDQELEDQWKKLDPNWLEYSNLLADLDNNAAELRERLMGQMIYHQIRVYLHLPFMLKSQSNSRFSYSRTACLNGSREVLRLYQGLRSGEVQPLYECKAVDFIGFTSAVLIMLGLFNFGTTMSAVSPKDQETDIRLIEMSIDIFRRASSEKGGRVALQSAEVLEQMLLKFKVEFGHVNGTPDSCPGFTEFVIPYFGTISIRRGGKPDMPSCGQLKTPTTPPTSKHQQHQQPQPQQRHQQHNPSISSSSPSQFTPSSENTSPDFFNSLTNPTSASTDPSQTFNFSDPFVSYDGFYNFPTTAPDMQQGASSAPNPATAAAAASNPPGGTALDGQINDDSMNNFPLPTNNFSWQNMPMDIDQDWSWFLNEPAPAGNNAAGAAGANNVGLGDAFTQQSYVTFG